MGNNYKINFIQWQTCKLSAKRENEGGGKSKKNVSEEKLKKGRTMVRMKRGKGSSVGCLAGTSLKRTLTGRRGLEMRGSLELLC